MRRGPGAAQEANNHGQDGSTVHGRATAPTRHDIRSKKGKGKVRESIGRSPLGIEVMSPEDDSYHEQRDVFDVSSASRNEVPMTSNLTRSKPTVFDADQAQVVSLALNLSESRRRQFSAARLSPAASTSDSRTVPSSALSPATVSSPTTRDNPYQRTKRGSKSPRNISRHFEQRFDAESPSNSPSTYDESNEDDGALLGLLPNATDAARGSPVYLSEATLVRVQRAKAALELSYEYRRLLQYLPKIPAASDRRPNSMFRAEQPSKAWSEAGRAYNPLQYIRNRKVRGRESKLLNAEAEGWKDVDAVRSWVERVAEERHSVSQQSKQGFSLPPHQTTAKAASDLQSMNKQSTSMGPAGARTELRPRVDWFTTPWDMLADTYWLEQADNKLLIEDRKGRKVFESQRPKAMTHSQVPKEPNRPTSKRSLSLPRSLKAMEKTSTLDRATKEAPLKNRGRPRHRRLQSFTSIRDYSSSRDRRKSWRPRLIRSDSSSSSTSKVVTGHASPRRRDHVVSSREEHDALILEKQIRKLIARQAKEAEIASLDQRSDGIPTAMIEKLQTSPQALEAADSSRMTTKSSQQLRGTSRTNSRPSTPSRETRMASFTTKYKVLKDIPPDRDPSKSRHGGIAINISPPRSRSRQLSKLSDPSSPDVDVDRDKGVPGSPTHLFHHNQGLHTSPSEDNIATQSPKTDSSVGHLSPQSAASFHRLKHKLPGRTHAKSRDSKDFESRLRGLLKGTKIAGIVGHPVAKVGDLIWKKDESDSDVFQSPATRTPDASDLEYASDSALRAVKSSAGNTPYGLQSRPQLPVFRSPFRGKENGRRNANSMGLQSRSELREGRTASRFAQIAPPPLDMRAISPSPVGSRTHAKPVEGGGAELEADDKDDGENRSPTQRRDAIANDFAKPPRRQETLYQTPIEPKSISSQWPRRDRLDFLWMTERLLSQQKTSVSNTDIQILELMTQSAATMFSNIVRQCDAVGTPLENHEIPADLALANAVGIHASARARMQETKAVAADIRSCSESIDRAIENFSKSAMPGFAKQLNTIEYKISSGLTPLVRTSGRDADSLSSELATTRTLGLKRLNDSIDLFVRRKRRRFRWLRRGVYFLLEWTLLGLMWWAWLIVTLIKVARVSITSLVSAVRWLFWL